MTAHALGSLTSYVGKSIIFIYNKKPVRKGQRPGCQLNVSKCTTKGSLIRLKRNAHKQLTSHFIDQKETNAQAWTKHNANESQNKSTWVWRNLYLPFPCVSVLWLQLRPASVLPGHSWNSPKGDQANRKSTGNQLKHFAQILKQAGWGVESSGLGQDPETA